MYVYISIYICIYFFIYRFTYTDIHMKTFDLSLPVRNTFALIYSHCIICLDR